MDSKDQLLRDSQREKDEERLDEMQRVGLRVLCQAAAMKSQMYDHGIAEFEGLNEDRTLF